MYYNKHYIHTDSDNNIIHGFSDAFQENTENEVAPKDICINKQGGNSSL